MGRSNKPVRLKRVKSVLWVGPGAIDTFYKRLRFGTFLQVAWPTLARFSYLKTKIGDEATSDASIAPLRWSLFGCLQCLDVWN